MKFVSKAAAFGAAAALTTAGLVAAAGGAADAATVTKSYTCSLPVGPSFQVPVAFTLPALPASVPAGYSIPALPVSSTMTLSPAIIEGVANTLSGLGMPAPTSFAGPITGSGAIGSTALPMNLTLPTTAISQTGNTVLKATGTTSAVKAPSSAGTYSVSLPTSITAKLLGSALPGATCTLPASQAGVGSIKVTKTSSAAPAPTKAEKKLAKDEKKLAKAKKAYKKAHGAKKAKLHKKVVKLKKVVKKDKKAVKAGK